MCVVGALEGEGNPGTIDGPEGDRVSLEGMAGSMPAFVSP
jgi:hypothetical protein